MDVVMYILLGVLSFRGKYYVVKRDLEFRHPPKRELNAQQLGILDTNLCECVLSDQRGERSD